MGVLTLVDPVVGTTTDATLIAANDAAIKAVINGGIDASNFAAGKIFTPNKIQQAAASVGQALVWNGTDWAPAAAGAQTYRKTTTKVVSNTVTETDLFNGEFTIAAGSMGANGLIRGSETIADILTNNAGNFRFRLKLGATTLIDTGANFAPANNANRTFLDIRFRIANLAATNAQIAWLWIGMTSGADTFQATTGTGGGGAGTTYHFAAWNTAAVDTTAAQTLVLTVQHNAASVNQDAKLYSAVVEVF